VRRGHERPERRAAQDVLGPRIAEEIGQVRVAAGELLDLEWAAGRGKLVLEAAFERRDVEALIWADGGGVLHCGRSVT